MHDFRSAILAAAAVCMVLFAAGLAHAQSPSERVDMLVGDAYADYDMLDLDAAEQKLLQALQLAQDEGVRSPGTAAAYIMLGVVWVAQTGDTSLAFQPFTDGLSIDPLAEIHPYYATPSLVAMLEEVRASAPPPLAEAPLSGDAAGWDDPAGWDDAEGWDDAGGSDYDALPDEADQTWAQPEPLSPPAPTFVLAHAPVGEAPAGRDIAIEATVSLDAPVARVVVNYRPFGNPNFFAVDLDAQTDGTTFRGEIPGNSTRGAVSIDYFIVAYDRAANSLGADGSASAPYTIFLLGSDDAPTSRGPSRSPREPSSRSPRERSPAPGEGEIAHLSILGGTGLGLATADPNVYADDVTLNPGLAPTPMHLQFELGFAPGRRALHIVPYLRLQLVFLDTGLDPLPLFGVRARYFFKQGEHLRAYAQGGLGYGEVSHLVRLDQIEAGTFDTTNEGPVHVGGGLGLVYLFSEHFGLQLDTYLMLMFNRVSVQVDVAAGPYIAF